ncbi:MAG: hypothetical protein COU11_00100 [Candidatus Harrisonbacteria bacterium CG10_big_fil_rev_8_21_14_0_10_49_15]|uniref:Fatty acid desaturase domain-containing protein n=1 Tax=Candidatus Harrisonbacteria bacterium CG10_big_fil_rev_8_21_14_0_10_49_15 TaxID=1974587 RepID=A0A2H0UM85_9BACT|nr:MAG: hypothetical protein COU11_00100 [Candidatus Harrisonbacteria bacterium CG10_big_fil_rev_8_21_14_0_10_49_15]
MNSETTALPSSKLDWVNISFLAIVHLATFVGVLVYLATNGLTLASVAIFLVLLVAGGISITVGYHRLYAHRSLQAHPVVQIPLLFIGAGQFQNSALKWASDHRRHHSKVDTDEDPYSIKKGFWWAHMGWLFYVDKLGDEDVFSGKHKDLTTNRLVMLQHRLYRPSAVLAGLVLPAMLGLALGDLFGGFVIGGLLRLTVMYHMTFCINSLAHTIGSQPFSKRDSARDSWITALFTWGEGYHNFHHRFSADYRNGIRWWQYDPGKWAIWLLARARLTGGLKKTPEEKIQKAMRETSSEMDA